MRDSKKYPLNQSQLYKCRSKRRLAYILQTNLPNLKKVATNPQYYSFSKAKKHSTETRMIDAPGHDLKVIQRAYDNLRKIRRPEWLIAGESGKSWTDNGKYHQNSNYFTKLDISKFFDNCKREYVYQFFFNRMHQSSDVSEICTSLVMFNYKVVQGAPTSMVVAYYAYERMFQELYGLANSYDLKFTVYVDDITFSSDKPFNMGHIKQRAAQIISAYGHKAKQKKIRSYGTKRVKKVTGVIINTDNELRIPNEMHESIHKDFQMYKTRRENGESLNNLKKERSRLIGKLNSARQISPNAFPGMWNALIKDDKDA